MQVYDSNFYSALELGVRSSSSVIIPYLLEFSKAQSVLDVGCGNGIWLKEFERNGIKDYTGIDGDYVKEEDFRAEFSRFTPKNLEEAFDLNRKFDLVISLEVAEHIGEKYSDIFVANLCKHSDVVAFSAAVPKQSGTNHVNEQMQSYWAEKFKKLGYAPYDIIRPKIWYNPKVSYWYRQNLIIYKKGSSEKTTASLDKLHPELLFVLQKKDTFAKKLLSNPYYMILKLLSKRNIL